MAALMLELIISPGAAAALGFDRGLRSRLLANYGKDPVVARIHELRLTIVEDVLGMDDGDGSGPSAIALLMKDPVPTATTKSTAIYTSTLAPSPSPEASSELTAVATASSMPAESSTPAPPTPMAMDGLCDGLSITSMWVESRDEIRARVRNDGSRDAKIVHTVFEWPDVPDPTYVDWFKFDGDKYYDVEDSNSPTVSSDRSRRVKDGRTETWAVDFDDKPDYGIYGSFSLTLTLEVSGLGTCTLSASTFRDFPTPTPGPTDMPEPTSTSALTETPTATPTPTETATPINTSTPVNTPTPVPPAATATSEV